MQFWNKRVLIRCSQVPRDRAEKSPQIYENDQLGNAQKWNAIMSYKILLLRFSTNLMTAQMKYSLAPSAKLTIQKNFRTFSRVM